MITDKDIINEVETALGRSDLTQEQMIFYIFIKYTITRLNELEMLENLQKINMATEKVKEVNLTPEEFRKEWDEMVAREERIEKEKPAKKHDQTYISSKSK